MGPSNSGKSTLAKVLKAKIDYHIFDMKAMADQIRSGMKNDEGEPVEADTEVPIGQVEKKIMKMIEDCKKSGKRMKYVFDGYTHAKVDDFYEFIKPLGIPSFLLSLSAEKKHLKDRHCKKSELEEYPADQEEALDAQIAACGESVEAMKQHLAEFGARCEVIFFDTNTSFETAEQKLVRKFSPQIILLNHEKRLGVDTTCANLAIKFNMIYISAFQII